MGGVVSKFAFLPPSPATYDAADPSLHWLTTTNSNKIPVKVFKYPRAALTVLFSHANAEDLGAICTHLYSLSTLLRCNVVGYDYSGYGHATGQPSEATVYDDANTVLAFTLQHLGTTADRVVVYGRSLGGGPSIELASKYHLAGVVLQSCFTSILDVAGVPVGFGLVDAFRNIDKISLVKAPVLIVHGRNDNIIPSDHSRRLYSRCRRPVPPLFISGAGHNDIEAGWFRLLSEHLSGFLQSLESKLPKLPAKAKKVKNKHKQQNQPLAAGQSIASSRQLGPKRAASSGPVSTSLQPAGAVVPALHTPVASPTVAGYVSNAEDSETLEPMSNSPSFLKVGVDEERRRQQWQQQEKYFSSDSAFV